MDSGVKTDLDGCTVGAGFEEEGVTLLAELIRLLSREDGVDLSLDGASGHGGVEDQDVGTKVDRTGVGWECSSCVCDLRGDGNSSNICSICGRHFWLQISHASIGDVVESLVINRRLSNRPYIDKCWTN